jgi:hypothetical protein
MNLKLIAISFAFTLSTLLFALTSWFEIEEQNLQTINHQHIQEIKKLQKISKINKWLNNVIRPSLEKMPNDANQSDEPIITFFDTYAKKFHFQLENYIYKDENTHNLTIKFELLRSEKETLLELMTLKYKKGFLQFNSFTLEDEKVRGKLRVIQPFYGDSNASHH